MKSMEGRKLGKCTNVLPLKPQLCTLYSATCSFRTSCPIGLSAVSYSLHIYTHIMRERVWRTYDISKTLAACTGISIVP